MFIYYWIKIGDYLLTVHYNYCRNRWHVSVPGGTCRCAKTVGCKYTWKHFGCCWHHKRCIYVIYGSVDRKLAVRQYDIKIANPVCFQIARENVLVGLFFNYVSQLRRRTCVGCNVKNCPQVRIQLVAGWRTTTENIYITTFWGSSFPFTGIFRQNANVVVSFPFYSPTFCEAR